MTGHFFMAQIGLSKMYEVVDSHPKAKDLSNGHLETHFVCTTCFHLTNLGKGYQHCNCESAPDVKPDVDCPNGYVLCQLCAQDVAGGLSRWSWLVCSTCHEQVNQVPRAGRSIPIGRHSIMNGHLWKVDVSEEVAQEQARQVVEFAQSQITLAKFGILQAQQLFSFTPELHELKKIPVLEWKRYFPVSIETSRWAISKFFIATGKRKLRQPRKSKAINAKDN